jgi:hypothetical protein
MCKLGPLGGQAQPQVLFRHPIGFPRRAVLLKRLYAVRISPFSSSTLSGCLDSVAYLHNSRVPILASGPAHVGQILSEPQYPSQGQWMNEIKERIKTEY